MLIFEDVDREKEVLVELSSIVAIEESHHGKNCFLHLTGGHKFHVTASVSAVREAMRAAKDNPTRDFEVSKEAGADFVIPPSRLQRGSIAGRLAARRGGALTDAPPPAASDPPGSGEDPSSGEAGARSSRARGASHILMTLAPPAELWMACRPEGPLGESAHGAEAGGMIDAGTLAAYAAVVLGPFLIPGQGTAEPMAEEAGR